MDDAQVFISYASEDHKVASTLCSALESRGFRCWISSRDIPPGDNFQVAIVRAIRNAKILLLVFTANSNNSQEMNKELALASQRKLAVVPLRIDDVAPNDAFRYEFATRQWIDFFADWELAMNQLAAQIAHIVGGPEQPDAPSTTWTPNPAAARPAAAAAKPAAKGLPLGLFLAIAVVLVLLLGGVLAMQLLGRKSATTATGAAPQAPAAAATPAPAVTILPTSAPPPSPSPAIPATPTVAGPVPEIAPQAHAPPRAPKPRAVAAAAPHAARGATQAVDESDPASAHRSNVPDEGDEAPPH